MNPGGHVVVTFVSQHTDNFRGQNLIQYADDRFPVRSVGTGNRAHLHVLARPSAKLLNIGDKWMLFFYDWLCFHCFFPFYECWIGSQQSLPRESLVLICGCCTGTLVVLGYGAVVRSSPGVLELDGSWFTHAGPGCRTNMIALVLEAGKWCTHRRPALECPV
jgi:hypothetical protein